MKVTSITFRLSEEEKADLMRIAAEKDIPLSQLVREAVRAYAESMLSKSEGGQEAPAGEDPMMDDPAMDREQPPMMESFIFTKKQLNTLMENFGPTEDELQKQDKRKPLPPKKEKTVSGKSPFNSPKFK